MKMDAAGISRAFMRTPALPAGMLPLPTTVLLHPPRWCLQRPRQRTRCRWVCCNAPASAADSKTEQAAGQPKVPCYGCGTLLQTADPEAPGYVEQETYVLKQKHRQLWQVLCGRCRSLSHSILVPAVQGYTGQQAGKPLITPAALQAQLAGIAQQRCFVLLLVDLMDASGSFLSRARDIVGRNPVLLLGTKSDLLPKGTQLAPVEQWLADTAAFKRLNVIGTHLVSSKTGAGIADAASTLLRQRQGRDVYVIGAANVGKSAFVGALLNEMANIDSRHWDAAAAQVRRRRPVESTLPGTTLGLIKLRAFASGGELYDTPGLHLPHRLPHMLDTAALAELQPRRRLSGYVATAPEDLDPPPSGQEGRLNRQVAASYAWGAVARIDVLSAPASARLVFYGPLKVVATPLQPAPNVATQQGFAAEAVAACGGLRIGREVTLQGSKSRSSIADVAISGLPGWAAVSAPGTVGQCIKLRIWVPVGIEVFVRPPLPVPNDFVLV